MANSVNLPGACFRLELVKQADDSFECKTSSIAFLNVPATQFMASSGNKSYALSAGVTVNLRLNRPTTTVFARRSATAAHFHGYRCVVAGFGDSTATRRR
jgi:hypothetical protein